MTTATRYLADRAAFRREMLTLPNGRLYGECEEPWQAAIWERLDERDAESCPVVHLPYLEMSRGMAKSTFGAMETITWALMEERVEAYHFAKDAQQAGIVRALMVGMIEANPALKSSFTVYQDRVEVPATGSKVTVMAADALSSFGIGGMARSLLVICDELWTWTGTQGAALWDSIISSTGKVAGHWRVLLLSNAGLEGESQVAWKVREVCRTAKDRSHFFWASPGASAGWISAEWKAEQRRLLITPNAYARLIDNTWQAPTSDFITPEDWDALVSADVQPLPERIEGQVFVGIDASLGRTKQADTTAAVAVVRVDGRVRLVAHRIWMPREGGIDYDQTVRPFVEDLARRYRVRVRYDPYQLVQTARQMSRDVPMEEYTQTPEHLTAMATTLLELVRSRSLAVYEAPDLRQQVLNAALVETPRGVKLDKSRSSRKIDGAVALAMAVQAAMTAPSGRPNLRFLPAPGERIDALEAGWTAVG